MEVFVQPEDCQEDISSHRRCTPEKDSHNYVV